MAALLACSALPGAAASPPAGALVSAHISPIAAMAGVAAALRWSWGAVEAALRVVDVLEQGSQALVRAVVEQGLETVEFAGYLSRVAMAVALLTGASYVC